MCWMIGVIFSQDAGQKHFGPVACSGCGMLYSAANHEDEAQHLLFHNQFVSAVKYVVSIVEQRTLTKKQPYKLPPSESKLDVHRQLINF